MVNNVLICVFSRHVKIYDITDYKVVHSIDYPSPILCLGLSVSVQHGLKFFLDLGHKKYYQLSWYHGSLNPESHHFCSLVNVCTREPLNFYQFSTVVQPDDKHIVVGMADELLSIKYRRPRGTDDELAEPKQAPRPGTYRYFVRGKNQKPDQVSNQCL